mmetsp:Transcript_6355/g.22684  ORF Transcript_6355/g.22684 Transcript_6355/m.22684 type:complete len:374 (+) Transcript_6355:266-1387(+)
MRAVGGLALRQRRLHPREEEVALLVRNGERHARAPRQLDCRVPQREVALLEDVGQEVKPDAHGLDVLSFACEHRAPHGSTRRSLRTLGEISHRARAERVQQRRIDELVRLVVAARRRGLWRSVCLSCETLQTGKRCDLVSHQVVDDDSIETACRVLAAVRIQLLDCRLAVGQVGGGADIGEQGTREAQAPCDARAPHEVEHTLVQEVRALLARQGHFEDVDEGITGSQRHFVGNGCVVHDGLPQHLHALIVVIIRAVPRRLEGHFGDVANELDDLHRVPLRSDLLQPKGEHLHLIGGEHVNHAAQGLSSRSRHLRIIVREQLPQSLDVRGREVVERLEQRKHGNHARNNLWADNGALRALRLACRVCAARRRA